MSLRIVNADSWAHREAFTIRYLNEHLGGAGPTEIGVAFGFDRERASSLFSSILLSMAKRQLVEKTGIGRDTKYKLVKPT